MDHTTRRKFLLSTTLLGISAAIPNIGKAVPTQELLGSLTDQKILFQGDSITDGNRTRDTDWNHIMGHGYQYIIASKLWYDQPDRKFHFINRGISGNKVTDLASRWQTDALDIKPDILSILVGVNDSNESVRGNANYTPASYERDYRNILVKTRSVNPNIKLVICEPFLLPVGAVKANWERWYEEVSARQIRAKDLAKEFDAVYVPFQHAFNAALKRAPADYWIWDGIHPMPAGHELMAREWLKAVGKGKLI